tara:strand:- start:664 stop:918 length:255 start_codon:yes stop_codon:yes gene_type:complete
MADFTQKDLSGSIFKNLKKTTDNQPHMSGSALINGVDYWVSAWTKPADKNGNRWQSLSFTVKDQPKTREQAEKSVSDLDDDIPF